MAHQELQTQVAVVVDQIMPQDNLVAPALSSSSTKRLLTECYLSPVPLNGLVQQV
jgi:hypothetical protein